MKLPKLIKSDQLITNKLIKNNKGQGLIEYLIIVALIAVAAIGIMQSLQKTVNSQFANVTNAIGGHSTKKRVQTPQIGEAEYKKRGLGSFMKRANNQKNNR